MKTILKPMAVLTIVTIILSTFCGCKKQPDISASCKPELSMKKVGDSYYFDVTGDIEADACQSRQNITFDSIDQFYTTLKTQNFTEEQAHIIAHDFSKDENGIKSCDPDKLCDLKVPEGFEYTDKLYRWSGEKYSVEFKTKSSFYGGLSVSSKEAYDSFFKYYYIDTFADNPLISVKKTYEINSGGYTATVYEYSTDLSLGKSVRFHIVDGSRTVYIDMCYTLEYLSEGSSSHYNVSDEHPQRIAMYCEENGQFYKILFFNVDFMPTVDWLLSFGIEPYRPADISLPVVGDEAAAATERPDFLQESNDTDS